MNILIKYAAMFPERNVAAITLERGCRESRCNKEISNNAPTHMHSSDFVTANCGFFLCPPMSAGRKRFGFDLQRPKIRFYGYDREALIERDNASRDTYISDEDESDLSCRWIGCI